MNQQPSSDPRQELNRQELNIDRTSITESQVGGIAGGDIVQNQGSGNIFKDVMINVFQGSQAEVRRGGLSRQEYRNRQALLHKVDNYWIKGVLEQSLNRRSQIALELETQPEAVLAPWKVVDHALDAQQVRLPIGTRLVDLFDQLGEGRSLLLLGDPGSGKTTALLDLTRELLDRAEQDVDQPIPVVVPLSSWASGKQTVVDWLVNELNSKYQVPKPVGEAWLKQQQLTLLLDGLDEVNPDYRQRCVAALNHFHQQCGLEIVVCCRTQDYGLLNQKLYLQTAVCLQPLTSEQVLHHLEFTGTEFAGLHAAIHQDATLQELAKSPLLLNLMTIAYQELPPAQLDSIDVVEARRQQLFDAYIDRMFHRREADQPYSRPQMIGWLSRLAQQMQRSSQTVFLIEEMQPDWLPASQHYLYNIGVKLVPLTLWGGIHVGLLAGHGTDKTTFDWFNALNGLAWGASGGILYGIIGGYLSRFVTAETKVWQGALINSALLGSIFGAVFGLVMRETAMPIWYAIAYAIIYGIIGVFMYDVIHEVRGVDPVDTLRWSWRKASRYAPIGIVVALVLKLGTSTSLPASLAIGMVFVIILGFQRTREVDRRTIPNYRIWRSAINASKLFVIVGVLSSIVFAIADRTIVSGIVNGLIFGLGAALIGAGGAGIHCIKHLILRLILWSGRHIPWNYARFLDSAADRIFLQKVGNGYVFIHRSLLEHFAQLR